MVKRKTRNRTKSITNKMILKLRSNAGESIAETLVALLISSVALLLLAGSVNTSSNLVTKSSSALDTYYKANNEIEKRTESAGSVTVQVSYDSSAWITCSANTYVNEEIGSTPVTAYHVQTSDQE